MKRVSLAGSIGSAGVVVGVLLAVLPSAGAANRTMHGVVLAKSSAKHTLAVSSTTGVVRTVHARSIKVGTRVDVVARQLRDGTFQAVRISTVGRAHTAQIHNAVVLRQSAGRLLVAAGGSRFTIRTTGRTLAGVGAARLSPGSLINATLRITSSGLLSLTSLSQVQSQQGPTGTSGTTGATGDDGDDEGDECTGTSGPSGTSGPTGTTGDDDEGDDEDCTGATGASGDEGDDDSGDDDSGDTGDDDGGDD